MLKRSLSLTTFAAALAVMTSGFQARDVVQVGDEAVPVLRSDGDGLDGLTTTGLSMGPSEALAACASWDVREACCPAGCAAKNGTMWSKADDILRGCMRGLGCSESEVKGASVFMKCDCPKR
jgi:hypothetical protein